jgi:hypothetical protein
VSEKITDRIVRDSQNSRKIPGERQGECSYGRLRCR